MTMSDASPSGAAPGYRIGTAARLAGIPVATLRMWERRYAVAGPRVTAGRHRRYTPADIARLTVVKRLVDLGHPIGAIAPLADAALRDLLTQARGENAPSAAPVRALRVALVGEPLLARARADAVPAGVEIALECADPADAARALDGVRADVVALELPGVRVDELEPIEALVQALGARRAVVAYRFATQAALRGLRERGHVVVRAPLELADLAALANEGAGAASALGAIPARRFDERALVALGRTASQVQCECPRHIAEILRSLGAFERYSAECAQRGPADAALHRHLERVAGTARALFEDALARVARAEGLTLPEQAAR